MTARPLKPVICEHTTELPLDVRVLYSIIPAQNEVFDCPGRPAEVDISDVLVGNVSILAALPPDLIDAIKAEIL